MAKATKAPDCDALLVLLAQSAQRLKAAGEALTALAEANEQAMRVMLPLIMQMAEAELVHAPLADADVVLTFSGSGCSDTVTAGELRAALAACDAAEDALEALGALGDDEEEDEP